MLLERATLADGSTVDVRIRGICIEEVAPSLSSRPGEEVEDLDGYLLLPAPVEPHAHLDKALTADQVPNDSGDLFGAIIAWRAYRRSLGIKDIAERARAAALDALARGATAIRTHVDVGEGIELRALEAVDRVRQDLRGLVDIQIVALGSFPLTGAAGADNRALLRAAVEGPADLVGAAPHTESDPVACLDFCLALATEVGLPLDLHTDETLDPSHLNLADMAQRVADGFELAVTASHCVSLGVQPASRQAEVAEAVAAAGIGVVTLPQTNLYLQGRGRATATPRGLTAVGALRSAGVALAAGGDNVQDPFNPLGRGDPLETASLLVAAAHLRPVEAYAAVSGTARLVMGLEPVTVDAGSPAELLAVRAPSIGAVLASATEDRLVVHRGRVVARTTVSRRFEG